jgi:hypothetical protein
VGRYSSTRVPLAQAHPMQTQTLASNTDGVVPGHVYGLVGMMIAQNLEQFRDLPLAPVMAGDDQGLAYMAVHCPKAMAAGGLHGGGPPHLLALSSSTAPAEWDAS